MLKHFMRYQPGWWILHLIVIGLTFWLGAFTRFTP
jgi:hypothetical protein